jgi:hypothetical protein
MARPVRPGRVRTQTVRHHPIPARASCQSFNPLSIFADSYTRPCGIAPAWLCLSTAIHACRFRLMPISRHGCCFLLYHRRSSDGTGNLRAPEHQTGPSCHRPVSNLSFLSGRLSYLAAMSTTVLNSRLNIAQNHPAREQHAANNVIA